MTTETSHAEVAPPVEGARKPARGNVMPDDGFVSQVTTPSGVEIRFATEPKRKYEVRKPLGTLEMDIHQRMSKWKEVPSVTAALEVLDKPALPWWGMKTGIEALTYLVETGLLIVGFDGQKHGFMRPGGTEFLGPYVNEQGESKNSLVDLVNEYKLTVNHVKNKAGDRGTSVHNFLEAWGALGTMPDVDSVPWEDKGYVTGLKHFLQDAVGLVGEAMEVTVASVKHGYAGRFDLLAKTTQDMRVVTKIYPKNAPKWTIVPAGKRLLIDLKTSKDIYPNHLLQLEAYEGGLVECGYGATDARAVLHVCADGRYEFRQAKGQLKDYVAVLRADAALKRTKEALKV